MHLQDSLPLISPWKWTAWSDCCSPDWLQLLMQQPSCFEIRQRRDHCSHLCWTCLASCWPFVSYLCEHADGYSWACCPSKCNVHLRARLPAMILASDQSWSLSEESLETGWSSCDWTRQWGTTHWRGSLCLDQEMLPRPALVRPSLLSFQGLQEAVSVSAETHLWHSFWSGTISINYSLRSFTLFRNQLKKYNL